MLEREAYLIDDSNISKLNLVSHEFDLLWEKRCVKNCPPSPYGGGYLKSWSI